ncbi:MAG: phage recombination protein Bet [Terricaulis sp.]
MTLHDQTRRLDFSNAQLKLIRRSVARCCTAAEFDEFMAVAAQCGLDPLRRQITPLIFAAGDPERRRLIPWTTIDGLRVIAARNNDYRPMEDAPIIEYDRARIDEAKNPLGIVRAEVRAWKASGGVWHAVVGEAWWDEFAPMSRSNASRLPDDGAVRSAPADADANSPPAEWYLDAAWKRAGRVMIAKCAEAQALRRGWPDLLSGLYGEEELKAARLIEHTASELLQSARDEEARRRKATRTLWFVSKAGAPFEPVSACDVEKFVSAIYLGAEAGANIKRFDEDNRASLATYWDWMPREAFRLKRMSETLQAAFSGNADEAVLERSSGDAQNPPHDARETSRGAEHER